MLIRSTNSHLRSIPNFIRLQTTSSTSNSTSTTPSTELKSKLSQNLLKKLVKSTLFGPSPPFNPSVSSKNNYQSTYKAQGWKELKKRGLNFENEQNKLGKKVEVLELKGGNSNGRSIRTIGWQKQKASARSGGSGRNGELGRRGFSTSSFISSQITSEKNQFEPSLSNMPLPSSTKSAPKSSNSRKKKRIQLRSIAAAASSSTSNTTSKPSLSSSKFKSKSTAILPPPRRAIPIPKQNRLPKAGDWVETRAKGTATHGIYLGTSRDDSARLIFITGNSDIMTSLPTDITFVIPSLVAPSIARIVYDSLTTTDEFPPIVEPELQKKVEESKSLVSRSIRKLVTSVELARMELIKFGAGNIYDIVTNHSKTNVKHLPTARGEDIKSISTKRVLSILSPHPSPSPPPSTHLPNRSASKEVINLLAVHQTLIEQPLHFLVDPISHKDSNTFTIRPKWELELFEQVRNWIRDFTSSNISGFGTKTGTEENLGALDSFLKKSILVEEWGRKHQLGVASIDSNLGTTSSTISDLEVKQGEDGLTKFNNLPASLNWSDSDLKFIQFLKLSLKNQRLIQISPYTTLFPTILKRFELLKRQSNKSNSNNSISFKKYGHSNLITSTDSTTTTNINHFTIPSSSIKIKNSFNRDSIMQFLISIGTVPKWENWSVHAYEEPLISRSAPVLPPTTITEAETLLEEKKGESYNDGLDSIRFNFGNLNVYTIDDLGAKELDDGVSIEEYIPSPLLATYLDNTAVQAVEEKSWWIHVHVADPTSILSPKSNLAKLAQKNYQTLYLPERTFSMLPEWFMSDYKLSLGSAVNNSTPTSVEGVEGNSNGEQKVMSFSTRINLKGERLESLVRVGIVKNVKRLTYDAVDQLLGYEKKGGDSIVLTLSPTSTSNSISADTTSEPVQEVRQTDDSTIATDSSAISDLKLLHQLARAVQKERAQHSLYWNFPSNSTTISPKLDHQFRINPSPIFYENSPEIKLTLPNSSKETVVGELTFSQTMVSEFMVLANRTAAKYCTENELPVPYRSQPAPNTNPIDLAQILELRDSQTGLVKGEDILKLDLSFDGAVTTSYPLPHWPMGIRDKFGYLKVTSPLRRYSDMICHWQIKSALLSTVTSPTTNQSSTSLSSSSTSQPIASHKFTTEAMNLLIGQFEEVEKLQKNLDKSTQSFWAHYVIKSKFDEINPLTPSTPTPSTITTTTSTPSDPIAEKVLNNLTCIGMRKPAFSLSEGFWSQRVLIKELGIRAQLDLGSNGLDGPGIGESVECKILKIILSENSRTWVGLKVVP